MDLYLLGGGENWTWESYLGTPPIVRELMLMYGQAKAEEQADRNK
jgi:hypothetical protein